MKQLAILFFFFFQFALVLFQTTNQTMYQQALALTPPTFMQSLQSNSFSSQQTTQSSMFDNHPNLQTVISSLGAIGYGTADFISEIKTNPPSAFLTLDTVVQNTLGKTRWAEFKKFSGGMMNGISLLGKLCNFAGPIISLAFSLISPSETTNDQVIEQVSSKIDEATQTILSQMQQNFAVLADFIGQQSLKIEQSIYAINQYAAQRALIDSIAILDNLNALTSSSKLTGVENYYWTYEQFPCGVAMTLCNNAYATIAYSMDDVLSSIYLQAVSTTDETYPLILSHGEYFLQLLIQSSASLATVNKLYTTQQCQQKYDPLDIKKHMILTNAQRLQQNYEKAHDSYIKWLFQSEHQITNVTISMNLPSPTNSIMKGVKFFKENLNSAIYSQSAWNSFTVLPTFMSSISVQPHIFTDYYIVNLRPLWTEDQKNTYSHPESNKVTNISTQCPQGTFLTRIFDNGRQYECVQLTQTIPQQYNDTLILIQQDSRRFTSTFEYVQDKTQSIPPQTQYISSTTDEQGMNCTKPGYFVTGIMRTYTEVVTICIQKKLGNYPSSAGQSSKYFYGLFYSVCEKGFDSTTQLYCAKPQYATSYPQCSMLRLTDTLQTFILWQGEMLNIDQVLDSLFISNPNVIYVEGLPAIQGPSFSSSTSLTLANDTYYIATTAARYPISNDDTWRACQLDLSKAIQVENSSDFAKLPLGTSWDIFVEVYSSRFIEPFLNQSNQISAEQATYSLTFTNVNPYPSTATFVLFLTTQQLRTDTILKTCQITVNNIISNLTCSWNISTQILRMAGNWSYFIAANSSLNLTFGQIYNPQANPSNVVAPLALYIYSDIAPSAFIEGSLRNIVPKLSCKWPCQKCSATDPTICLSCANNLPERYLINTTCANSCDTFIHNDTTINTLKCVSLCPQRFFANENNFCLPCHSSCLLCNGSGAIQCASCDPSSIYSFLNNGQCVQNCPTTSFIKDNTCVSCVSGCAKCSTSSNNCTQCSNGFNLFNSTCVQQCPTGWQSQNNVCMQCDSTCQTCSGPTKTNCTTCNSTSRFPLLYQQSCVNSCPNTTYLLNSLCQPCNMNCGTCNLAPNTCTSCATGMYLYNGKCYDVCPAGTFSSGNQCLSCISFCKICSNTITCAKCTPPYILSSGKCQMSQASPFATSAAMTKALSLSNEDGILQINPFENNTISCGDGSEGQYGWFIRSIQRQQYIPIDEISCIQSIQNKLFIFNNCLNETSLQVLCDDGHNLLEKTFEVTEPKSKLVKIIVSVIGGCVVIILAISIIYWKKHQTIFHKPITAEVTYNSTIDAREPSQVVLFSDSSNNSLTRIVDQLENAQNDDKSSIPSPPPKHNSFVVQAIKKLSWKEGKPQFSCRVVDKE